MMNYGKIRKSELDQQSCMNYLLCVDLVSMLSVGVDVAAYGARSLYARLQSVYVQCSMYEFCGVEWGRL